MKLVIAEKAELARNIAHAVAGAPEGCRLPYRGGGYTVCALAGHVLEMDELGDIDPERWADRYDLSVLPILPRPWPMHVKKGKERALGNVAEALKECDEVIAAGDPDDEGQLLVDEVLEHLGCDKPVMRVFINDNLDANIRKAFGKLQPNERFTRDGDAARARAIADFAFGVNESRLIAARAGSGAISVGRVQTPTLGLVVRRDAEIAGHVKRPYYTGSTPVEVDGERYAFELKLDRELLDDEGKRCTSKETVWAALTKARGMAGTVETTVKRESYQAPLPYNLTDLTADMSRRYKMSANDVMEATQALREEKRAITYNRSDCNYLPEEAHAEAPSTMASAMANVGADWKLDFSIKGRAFNDKNITAHTGIIPQDTRFDVSKLPRKQKLVYEAIVERYAMQFMPAATADVSTTAIPVEGGDLVHKAKRAIDAGWKAVRGAGDADDKEMQEGFIEAGSHAYKVLEGEVKEAFTKPRPPYTEGTLIKDMASIAKYVQDPEMREVLKKKDEGKKGEHGGIGTTATRAGVLEALKNKGYIEERSGKLISTPLGRDVYNACPEEIRGADMTARWWLMCEEVREGSADVYSVAESVVDTFNSHKETAYAGIKVQRAGVTEVATCPLCGAAVVDKGSKAKRVQCSSNRWEKDEQGAYKLVGGCGFGLWKTVAGKKLTNAQLKALIEKGRTGTVKGFKSKAGKSFDAALVLQDAKSGTVAFEFPDRGGKGAGKAGTGARGGSHGAGKGDTRGRRV